MEYVIAHDLGTSGYKASLVGTDGKVVMDETYHYNTCLLYTSRGL